MEEQLSSKRDNALTPPKSPSLVQPLTGPLLWSLPAFLNYSENYSFTFLSLFLLDTGPKPRPTFLAL